MAMGQEDDARSYWRKTIREKPEAGADVFRAANGVSVGG
jgi:hypothetical protein